MQHRFLPTCIRHVSLRTRKNLIDVVLPTSFRPLRFSRAVTMLSSRMHSFPPTLYSLCIHLRNFHSAISCFLRYIPFPPLTAHVLPSPYVLLLNAHFPSPCIFPSESRILPISPSLSITHSLFIQDIFSNDPHFFRLIL